MKKMNGIFITILCMSIAMTACKENETSEKQLVKRIDLERDSVGVAIGKTLTINPTVLPDKLTNPVLSWTSENPSVVTVSNEGVLTGVSFGVTHITIASGSVSKRFKVSVFTGLTDIELDVTGQLELRVLFGMPEEKQVVATSVPANSEEPILWSTSNADVATVSEAGLITAVAPGTAVITVEGRDKEVTKQISIKVAKVGDDPVKFNKTLFRRSVLPGDNYEDKNDSWKMEGLWDDKQYSASGSSCVPAGIQSITFDMGAVGYLSIFHLFTWESRQEGYPPFVEQNLKKFEVWGAETLDETGAWESWTKLMDCDVIKPSGLPEYEYNEEDVFACTSGQKFYNIANNNVPVRYIRIKVLETWGGFNCWRAEELTIYGTLK